MTFEVRMVTCSFQVAVVDSVTPRYEKCSTFSIVLALTWTVTLLVLDNFRLLPITIVLIFLMFNVSLLFRSQSHTVCKSSFSCQLGWPRSNTKQYRPHIGIPECVSQRLLSR